MYVHALKPNIPIRTVLKRMVSNLDDLVLETDAQPTTLAIYKHITTKPITSKYIPTYS